MNREDPNDAEVVVVATAAILSGLSAGALVAGLISRFGGNVGEAVGCAGFAGLAAVGLVSAAHQRATRRGARP